MLDLQAELHHLAAAQRQVRDAEVRIAQLDQLIAYASSIGESTASAQGVRDTMRDVLDCFVSHRDAIVRALKLIRAGRL